MPIQQIVRSAGNHAPYHFLELNRQSLTGNVPLREMYGFNNLGAGSQKAVDLAMRLSHVLADRPDSNLFDVLKNTSFAESSSALAVSLASAHASFPLTLGQTRNPSYSSIQLLMMGLPKTDCHVHISKSMHETEIAKLTVNTYRNNTVVFNRMMSNLRGYAAYDDVLSLATDGRAEELAALLIDKGLLTTRGQAKYEDYYVADAFTLQEAARCAALRGLQDGVTRFDVRFNPAKKDMLGDVKAPLTLEQWDLAVRISTDSVLEGIGRAKQEAHDDGYLPSETEPAIGVMFSFSRDKEYAVAGAENKMTVQEMARRCFLNYGDRINGVDISGPEYASSDYPDEQIEGWREFLHLVSVSGKRVTVHLGDMRFSGASKTMAALAQAGRSAASEAEMVQTVLQMTEAFLPYVSKFIDVMPVASGIGHGYFFDPEFLVSPLWGHGEVNGIDITQTAQGASVADRISELSQRAMGKGLFIETCPAATLRETNKEASMYEQLSLYRWLEAGWNVRLGTDAGVFSYNRPRVLSEIMTNLLLTRPAGRDALTVRQLLNLVGIE